MAETTYSYVAADFPSNQVNPAKLKREIEASSIATPLTRVDTLGGTFSEGVFTDARSIDIVFDDPLSAGEKTTLDGDTTNPAGGLIAAHDNTPAESICGEATQDPGATQDADEGFSIGSRIINTATGNEFVCIDATPGAAVWKETTQSGGTGAVSTVLDTWALVSGDLYQADFAHNLGTEDLTVFLVDTATDREVRAEEIEILDNNTLRVIVRGNTHSIKTIAVTGSGPAGPAGQPGSVWFNGSGAPAGGLGVIGDYYINNDNGNYYEKTLVSTWTLLGNLTRSVTIRQGHTWAISGEIEVASRDDDFIIPFFVSIASGQSVVISNARYRINSGTSVKCNVTRNGSPVAGYTEIKVTTTNGETNPADVALSDGDLLAVVVTEVSGNPQNLTFTLFLEHTA